MTNQPHTTKEATHTPLKLSIDKKMGNWIYHIIGKGNVAQEARIAELNPYLRDVEETGKHIINCVNSHDELVSALRLALRLIGDISGSNIDTSLNYIKKALSKAGVK